MRILFGVYSNNSAFGGKCFRKLFLDPRLELWRLNAADLGSSSTMFWILWAVARAGFQLWVGLHIAIPIGFPLWVRFQIWYNPTKGISNTELNEISSPKDWISAFDPLSSMYFTVSYLTQLCPVIFLPQVKVTSSTIGQPFGQTYGTSSPHILYSTLLRGWCCTNLTTTRKDRRSGVT